MSVQERPPRSGFVQVDQWDRIRRMTSLREATFRLSGKSPNWKSIEHYGVFGTMPKVPKTMLDQSSGLACDPLTPIPDRAA